MDTVIEHFLKYLKVERNASEHTLEAYGRDLDQFIQFIIQDPTSLSPERIEECLRNTEPLTIRLWLGTLMEGGLGRATIARKAASIRSFFKYAHRRGYLDQNPAQLLLIPKQAKRIPTVISENEMENLLSRTSDGTAWSNQVTAILELFYSTGIRLRELVSLNEGDVDFKQQQISVIGKGQKQRIVPFGIQAQKALIQHLETRRLLIENESYQPAIEKDNAVFLTKKGKRIYPRLVQKIVKERIDEVSESNKKSPHVLRHSFATHMLNAGADIRMIKEFLGHSSLAATQIYTHTGVEHLKRIHEQSHPRAKNMEQSKQPLYSSKLENGDSL